MTLDDYRDAVIRLMDSADLRERELGQVEEELIVSNYQARQSAWMCWRIVEDARKRDRCEA